MAQAEAKLLLKIKQVGAEALTKTKTLITGIAENAKVLGAGLLALGAGAVAAAKQFGEFEGVRRSFTNLANSQGQDAQKMLANMRELSRGTVSDLDLMKKANNALLLGLPVDRFGDMLKIAQSSAAATGQSMDFMLNSIVTGLGRGSKLMLDNLGIIFDLEKANQEYAASLGKTSAQLTDAEKKQAFINKALAIGLENVKKAGTGTLTLNQQMEKLTASMQNAYVVIGGSAAPAVGFFTQKINEMFDAINQGTQASALTYLFEYAAKGIVIVAAAFEYAGKRIGIVVGGIVSTLSNLIEGNLRGAWMSVQTFFEEMGNNVTDAWKGLMQDLDDIDKAYSEARVNRVKGETEQKLQAFHAEKEAMGEAQLKAWEDKMNLEFDQKASELDLIGATEDQKLAYVQASLDRQLKMTQDFATKKRIFEAKEAVLEMQRQEKQRQMQLNLDQAHSNARLQLLQATANFATAVMGRESKAAFLMQQAAAIAGAYVAMHLAAAQALAVPPAPNFALAGMAKTAGFINIAAIAAQTFTGLAEGGIVPATPGGIPAVIGEGGRSEAVIPLPDDFDPDNGLGSGSLTVVFNGPLMGDRGQAREFAMMIDQQLLELRRNNQSVAFDQDVI